LKVKETDKTFHGLTDSQAREKLKEHGYNSLSEKSGLPWFVKYLLLMTGLFNYMLWVGSILCFIAFGV